MATSPRRVRVYIAEEQQILREAYQSFFLPRRDIEIVGTSGDTSGEALARAAQALEPSVLLLGIKVLQPAVVEKLNAVRDACPKAAVMLLSASYDVKGITALREFSKAGAGCAFLLKHTVDTVEQLIQVVHSVAEGRIIVDHAVMECLIATSETRSSVLKDLSPRELEVLSWMAKGYRNQTIAEVLCLEPKTVERHINNIYGKLGSFPDARHARVHAVMLYLQAVGHLPAEAYAA